MYIRNHYPRLQLKSVDMYARYRKVLVLSSERHTSLPKFKIKGAVRLLLLRRTLRERPAVARLVREQQPLCLLQRLIARQAERLVEQQHAVYGTSLDFLALRAGWRHKFRQVRRTGHPAPGLAPRP